MKMEIVFTVVLLTVALTVSIYIADTLRRKKRFSNHRIVREFVDCWSDAMIQRISQSVASEKERFLVVAEHAKISDDSILSECCSVFFSHEHMRHLQTERERWLMACAIAGQIKRRVIEKCSSNETLANKNYRIKTKCQSVLSGSQKSFLVYIHYIMPNESYVQIEKW